MKVLQIAVAGAVLALIVGACETKPASTKESSAIPAPFFPRYVHNRELSDEELMFLARGVAREVETRGGALGKIGVGEKGLIMIKDAKHGQDMRIVEACIKALKERGADADYIYTTDLVKWYGGLPQELPDIAGLQLPPPPAGQGLFFEHWRVPLLNQWGANLWDPKFVAGLFPETKNTKLIDIPTMERLHARLTPEVKTALPRTWRMLSSDFFASAFLIDALKRYLDVHPEYGYVFLEWFNGGTMDRIMSGTSGIGKKFQYGWRIPDTRALVGEGSVFPADLWRLIEDRTIDMIPWISHARVTDPEGTDFEFSTSAEDSAIWRLGAYYPDYMRFYPLQATGWSYGTGGVPERHIAPEAKGVIVGSSAEGWYKKMSVYLDHGKVQRVEGGGRVGELFRGMLNDERIQKAQYPLMPYPGNLYMFQYGISSNVKAVASYQIGTPRSIVDLGFGFESTIPFVMQFAEANNLPLRHGFHMRQYFPTYEVELRSRGKKVHTMKIMDRGRLTAMDNPEVRALAARYGEPGVVLEKEFVVDIPGINRPGMSLEEFQQNPTAYAKKRWEEVRAGTYPYLVERPLPFTGPGYKRSAATQ